MMKRLFFLLTFCVVELAHADRPEHFIRATCVPEMDYFEISISSANNPKGLYELNNTTHRYQLKKSIAKSLRKKGIVILLEPGNFQCSLHGMNITVKNAPYEPYERNIFPGSRISLIIGDHIYAKEIDLFTGSFQRPYLTKVLVDGDGPKNEHGHVYYTAMQSYAGPEFSIYQPFPSKSTVTDKTLAKFDGRPNLTLYPQDDGTVR